jgi:hypothetical protein
MINYDTKERKMEFEGFLKIITILNNLIVILFLHSDLFILINI